MADDEFNGVTLTLGRAEACALFDLLSDVRAGHPIVLDDSGTVTVLAVVTRLRRGSR